ncbi:sorbosone dehydrogenase family protein [Nemorincola caseinilytica]|uniref:Sorbosone dehydrogenase family protein n=1 Tax=Nemorincola caseinilytica TaxID=2054315 RepID=A0ABP8N518_9BACT
MKTTITITTFALFALMFSSCGSGNSDNGSETTSYPAVDSPTGEQVATRPEPPYLPAPFATRSVKNYSDVVGWPEGATPHAPQGFTVTRFAGDLDNPRWIYVGPNGDIFVCESKGKVNVAKAVKAIASGAAKSANENRMKGSADRITMFRDANNDGIPEERHEFLKGLNHPLGMLIVNGKFYVANNDAVVAYPYQAGQTSITAKGTKVTDIPAGAGHWTRNIIASSDGGKIYIAVGSGSNVAENGMEKEEGRAMIWVMNTDGTGKRKFATGLRNPVGMAWAPGGMLWTAVNERDELGDDLVPDYITSVQDGGFYGWPYCYWGQNEDPRMKDKQRPDLVSKAIVPDVSMGPHTAALGLAFDNDNVFPGRYKGGAYVGQHGSWNRSVLSGYAVVFVPFKGGEPAGKMEPFLTGFIADSAQSKVYGRPVGVTFTRNAMLVADDAGNTIWRVAAK